MNIGTQLMGTRFIFTRTVTLRSVLRVSESLTRYRPLSCKRTPISDSV